MLQPLEPNNVTSGFLINDSGEICFYSRGVCVFRTSVAADVITFVAQLGSALTLSSGEALRALATYRIPSASGMETDGLHGAIAGCDQVLDVTKTEAGATFCFVWDDDEELFEAIGTASAGTFTQWALFPGTTEDDDAVYFGGALQFCQLYFDMSATVQTYTGDATVWEYWDGSAWTALVVHDYTDASAQDGLRSFGRDGAVSFMPPADWAETTVNSVEGFWIRVRAGAAANISQVGITNAKRQYVCSPADGFVAQLTGTITDLAIRDEAATPHTAADVKFVLFNFTTGESTGELNFAMDKRNERFGGFELEVTQGDVLGIVITQGDGTNEIGPAGIELGILLP